MDNLDKDLKEMRRLGYTSYGKYKLDYPNTRKQKSNSKPVQKKPQQHAPAEHQLICSFCGKTFTSHLAHKMYCSTECCRKNAKKRYEERKSEGRKARSRACLICGTEFKQVRASHKYCSPECKRTAALETQRQWRARLKESKNGISV